jgi:hypothetical protein
MRSLRAEILQSWLTDRDIQELGGSEVRAVIDALALAVYADFEVNIEEEVELESLLMALPRPTGGTDREAEMEEAKTWAANVESAESLSAFIDSVATRLPKKVYDKVYAMVVTITVADRELLPDEETVLAAFAEGFGISERRAAEITAGTLRRLRLETEDAGE